jgi:imidazoleglycerol-phosphate dehydratase
MRGPHIRGRDIRVANAHQYAIAKSAETDISVGINLRWNGIYDNRPAWAFFDHMLDQCAPTGFRRRARRAICIDDHHTVEDVGIALGQALVDALGDKRGVLVTATATCMDDAQVALCPRCPRGPTDAATLICPRRRSATCTELVREFFQKRCRYGRHHAAR